MLLVSNRLPISVRRSGGKTAFVRSAGGLVAGLGPIHDEGSGLWIGNLGGVGPSDPELRKRRLVPVELPTEDAKRHYEGFSNRVLWPLCHYLIEHVGFEGADFDAYRKVNQRFADVVARHAHPRDTIWVHDYHLMLLPGMLRERLPEARIGFFMHIPFPSSEVFRLLPRKEEILRGLLGADLIGVHTYDYGRHLVSSFRRILGVEFDDDWVSTTTGRCKVGVFPIGIDVAALVEAARSPQVERRVERIKARIGNRKIILGVDRLDYTKGLPLRLRAFRRLLEMEPRWRTEAVLLQLAVPTRSTVAGYKELRHEVERLVGAINGAFGQPGATPVEYMYRSVPPDELAALYRAADVGWVTPIRDGMNLVAKEYVAHQLDDDGVLVLSEFAGAASEMGEALMCNPWDVDGSARVLDRALRMNAEERREHMRFLRRRVRAHDVHRWVQRFLEALARQAEATERARAAAAGLAGEDEAWRPRLLDGFARARRRLLALDYDGTLVPLRRSPGEAAPTDDVLGLLRELSSLPNTEVVAISGRQPQDLSDWLGPAGVHLVAEHGLQIKLRGDPDWEVLLGQTDLAWKHAVREILDDYTARTPGAFIEEKSASLAWHYRKASVQFGEWQARELTQHLSESFANSPVEVLHGSKVVEVRPQGINKGRTLGLLLERLGPFDFVLAAGDDRTDEDMFHMLETHGNGGGVRDPTRAGDGRSAAEVWTIKIGRGPTAAHHRLSTTAQLLELLAELRHLAARGDEPHLTPSPERPRSSTLAT